MSRITKWQFEKTKVKVVFRLQFHATHIPQTGWDKLFISFIPADSAKPTAKTTKANVRNGTCKWADPIYETTRLLQDTRTKQYDEKLYKLVVAMGSSRSSILGEANINLAEFADASKPSAIPLLLNGCEAGATLHVTVQLLTSKTGFREFEQQRELREKGIQSSSDQSSVVVSSKKEMSPGKKGNNHVDKVNARAQFKRGLEELPCLSSIEEEAGVNEDFADTAVAVDESSNTSESMYAEKHDLSSTHEVESLKSTMSGDLDGLSFNQSPKLEKADASDNHFRAQSWVSGLSSEYATTNEITTAHEENNRLRSSLEDAQSSILELKSVVISLQSYADEVGSETKKFSQHLAAEIYSSEELSKEVTVLKSECLKLKLDLEEVKSNKLAFASRSKESVELNEDIIIQNVRLKWLEGLLFLEDRLIEFQKVCLGNPERELSCVNTELQKLVQVLQDLKERIYEPVGQIRTGTWPGAEGTFQSSNVSDTVACGSGTIDPTILMKKQIFELLQELEQSKTEQTGLARKMDQMECYYEAFVQELEQNQRHLMEELQKLRNEHSACLYTLSSSKSEMEKMQHELNDQMIKFAEEKCNLEFLNKDLERRAVAAESALKRARLNYSIAVKQLQKDLELLSCQVISMYETNENLIKQAFSESLLTSFDGHPESMQTQKLDSVESLVADPLSCQNWDIGAKQQQLGTDIILKDLKQSLQMQEGLYQKVEEEVCEMHLVNLYMDVFSQVLRETLLEASADITILRENIVQLSHKLELSSESKEILMLKLQDAMDDIHSLNQYKANCIAKNDDLAQTYQLLQSNFEKLSDENLLLTQKIKECEALLTETRSCKGEYEVCRDENIELTNLLKKEKEENEHLHSEMSLVQSELNSVRIAFDDLAFVKDNLQNSVKSVSDKLQLLLDSFHHNFHKLSLWGERKSLNSGSNDLGSLIMQLEELQLTVNEKVWLLMEEKNGLMNEKNIAEASLSSAKTDIEILKKELENNIKNMASYLSVSSVQVHKLQSEFEAFVRKLKVRCDTEEVYTQQHNNILSDLDHLETELLELTQSNDDFTEQILALNSSVSDLEACKQTIADLTKQNEAMMVSLQEKSMENLNMASEINQLKECLHSVNTELQAERSLTGNLKSTVRDLEACKQIIAELTKQNEAVMVSLQEKSKENLNMASEIDQLKESLHSVNAELHAERISVENLKCTVRDLEACKQTIADLTEQNEAMMVSLQEKSKENLNMASEVDQFKDSLHSIHSELHAERSLTENLMSTVRELEACKQTIAELTEQNEAMLVSLVEKSKEVFNKASELDQLKEHLNFVNAELHAERCSTENLRSTVSNITSELNEKDCYLQDFDQQKSEVLHLKQLVLDLELEKSKFSNLLMQSEQHVIDLSREYSCLDTQISEIYEHEVTMDVDLTVTRCHCRELVEQLCFREGQLYVLNEKCLKIEAELSDSIAKEAYHVEENKLLLTSLNSTRSELEALISQNRALVDQNGLVMEEVEEYKNKIRSFEEVSFSKESQHAVEIERMKHLLANSYEVIEELMVSKEEVEVKVLLLHSKLDEMLVSLNSLQQFNEVRTLQKQCSELSKRLSEQILKTEEYKNLSIHLKELKDKADAECLNAREKGGSEVQPAVAMQESLRIAFIKEQYETKLQDVKQQLSVSKKHGEEVLWKFQDAIDEVENKRKSEASLLKRNEELAMKILDLEAELQSVISEKREIMKAYDFVKAEKECSAISLECCKEEKEELEASVKKCEEEKSKITEELKKTKELIGSLRAQMNFLSGRHATDEHAISQDLSKSQNSDILTAVSETVNGSSSAPYVDASEPTNRGEIKSASSTEELVNTGLEKDLPLCGEGKSGIQHCGRPTKDLQCYNPINMSLNSHLRSSMELLNQELERMKNENSLHSADKDNYELCFPGLQRELMRLHKANEELQTIFPMFKDISVTGNAIERVLALEIELAERLMTKKISGFHFESSFLKQHSDEGAIFQSFRDINELIKDMLELKSRHMAVETELKEMHERYSQLSLQFAEVEGERQKLMMTLRNSRTPKKALLSSLSFMDHS